MFSGAAGRISVWEMVASALSEFVDVAFWAWTLLEFIPFGGSSAPGALGMFDTVTGTVTLTLGCWVLVKVFDALGGLRLTLAGWLINNGGGSWVSHGFKDGSILLTAFRCGCCISWRISPRRPCFFSKHCSLDRMGYWGTFHSPTGYHTTSTQGGFCLWFPIALVEHMDFVEI